MREVLPQHAKTKNPHIEQLTHCNPQDLIEAGLMEELSADARRQNPVYMIKALSERVIYSLSVEQAKHFFAVISQMAEVSVGLMKQAAQGVRQW
jgi:hypothetical protein